MPAALRPSRLLGDVTIFLWALAMLIGGGTQVGLDADLLLQLIALPLAIGLLVLIFGSEDYGVLRRPALVVVALFALGWLQLVPLPPAIWQQFGGRDAVVAVLQAAGQPVSWHPISLAPHATIYGLASLMPPLATFLGMLVLAIDGRFWMIIIPITCATANVFIGEIQTLSHIDGVRDADPSVSEGYGAGLFANRNHYAAMIYALVPLTVGWTLLQRGNSPRMRVVGYAVGILTLLAFVLGLGIAYSRAGVGLGLASFALSGLLFWRSRSGTPPPRWLTGVILAVCLVLVVIGQLGFLDLIRERGLTDLVRQRITEQSVDLVLKSPLVGYGFGTFVPIYMGHELPTDIFGKFINHAHNDWIEITMEAGIFAALVLVLYLIWAVWRSFFVWTAADNRQVRYLLARAATIPILLLLVHSVVDYPLRTTALATTFAVCCALLLAPARGRQKT